MRKGWEYKRWKEVLTIINGKNQSAVVDENGEYPIYGSGGIMGYANNWLCPENCVIIGRKGNINKPIFVETKFWNVDTAFGLNANIEYLLPKFLFYFCLDYNFERHNKAVTIPSLTKADLLKIDIPLPPKSTQLAIVSELDKINELIRLKKEQLKDFDNLAQSLFYEMFGDPVENEKGWEVKKIKDIAKYYNGVAHEQDVDKDGDFVLINAKFISSEGQIKKYSNIQRFPLLKNDIVMVLSDLPNGKSLAKCFLIDEDNKYTLNQRICCFRGFEGSSVYLKNIINRNPYLLSFDNGKGQTNLRKGDVEKLPIPLPPLSLQHLFAQRIEQIEREKSEVQKSIQDLETLLASRMQYWFE